MPGLSCLTRPQPVQPAVIFPTTTFAVFFCIVLVASWMLMPHPRFWRLFIIGASFVFYADWNWKFVGLLAFSILWNQAIGVGIHRSGALAHRKALLALGVVVDVGLLGYFKYYDFFVESGHNFFADIGLGFPFGTRSIILPVGISFFTFMAISYIVDIYRRELEPASLGKFGAYLSFFPHLVAGPIVRGSELLPQLDTPRDPRRVDTSRAFYLIATGLFKKVVIANYLATHVVDQVFGAPNQHSSLETWVAVYAYAVQIYADFSGYTDMAIGLALLLGFKFPQNFDSPYAAISIQDFWRRWHMTLSRWLRDYVYIPLGGNRKGEPRTYLNLMATMLIGGLWHGAGWSFVIWGGLHGAWLAIGRYRREHGLAADAVGGWALWRQRIVTFNLVCFAWIFFRAGSEGGLSTAWDVIARLFDNWGAASPLVSAGVVLAIVVGIGTQYLPARIPQAIMARFSEARVAVQIVVLALALMVSHTMGPQGVAPFIYFRF
jgi:alginate O-acetyltransferase complex protein AlgI